MPKNHRVSPGECIESIAAQAGLFPPTIWQAAENSALRERRADPHALAPGDVLVIPDLRIKEVAVETGKHHVFRRKGVPASLRIRLVSGGEPRQELPYQITIDGEARRGVTDADGWVIEWIPPAAQNGELRLGDNEVYTFALGDVGPVDRRDGLRARLVNLGYLDDREAPDSIFELAVRRFRADHDLPDGGVDDSLRQALIRAHRS